jgi:hypothetical protein
MLLVAGAGCVESKRYLPPPPPPPALRSPMSGAFVGSALTMALRPRLAWVGAEDRDDIYYRVQISPDASFATVELESETLESSFQPEAPLPVSFGTQIGRAHV